MSESAKTLRDQEVATNKSKEEAMRSYDEALRVTGHPNAGSKVGDHLTEAAYAAGHRLEEVTHRAQDALKAAVSHNPSITTTTSETK